MISLEGRLCLVLLFLAEPEEPEHVRSAVRAVLPLARRPPREFRRFGRALERFTRIEQCLDVHAVVHCCRSHHLPPVALYYALKLEAADHTSPLTRRRPGI